MLAKRGFLLFSMRAELWKEAAWHWGTDAAADGLTAAAKRRDSRHRAEVATLIASLEPNGCELVSSGGLAPKTGSSSGGNSSSSWLEWDSFNNFSKHQLHCAELLFSRRQLGAGSALDGPDFLGSWRILHPSRSGGHTKDPPPANSRAPRGRLSRDSSSLVTPESLAALRMTFSYRPCNSFDKQ